MDLNLGKDLLNNLKENKFVQNFMKELSNYLENNSKKDKQDPIIEKILSNKKATTGNENEVRWKEDETIIKYAQSRNTNEPIYFVKDDKKIYWQNNERYENNNVYNVYKIENGKIDAFEINKKDMPKNIGVNDVFTIENGKYIIDNLATKEIQEELTNMANEILSKQNINLDAHRKENHLYMVTEKIKGKCFMWDLTEKSKIEFEETELEHTKEVSPGDVFQYKNGKYEYYSDNGFEMAEKLNDEDKK